MGLYILVIEHLKFYLEVLIFSERLIVFVQ